MLQKMIVFDSDVVNPIRQKVLAKYRENRFLNKAKFTLFLFIPIFLFLFLPSIHKMRLQYSSNQYYFHVICLFALIFIYCYAIVYSYIMMFCAKFWFKSPKLEYSGLSLGSISLGISTVIFAWLLKIIFHIYG